MLLTTRDAPDLRAEPGALGRVLASALRRHCAAELFLPGSSTSTDGSPSYALLGRSATIPWSGGEKGEPPALRGSLRMTLPASLGGRRERSVGHFLEDAPVQVLSIARRQRGAFDEPKGPPSVSLPFRPQEEGGVPFPDGKAV